MSILQNRLTSAEFNRTVWQAQPEPGTTLEEMLKPEYWAHVAKNLKKGDRIEIVSGDGEWFAELHVRGSNGASANVFPLRHVTFGAKAQTDAGVEIKHRGAAGWSVIRKSDKKVLHEKAETREDAESWLRTAELAA